MRSAALSPRQSRGSVSSSPLQERLALAKELFAERDPIPRLLAWRTPDERERQQA